MKFTEQLKTLLSFVNDGNVLCHAGGSKIKKSGITVWSLTLTSIGLEIFGCYGMRQGNPKVVV